MEITGHAFTDALLGGILIGLASSLLLYSRGRVFGISGILAGVFHPHKEEAIWRTAIVVGLLAGGIPIYLAFPEKFSLPAETNTLFIIAAGLLVGFGTRLGSGCTSGHGVCGISRFSPRSILATLTFILTGIIAVALFH